MYTLTSEKASVHLVVTDLNFLKLSVKRWRRRSFYGWYQLSTISSKFIFQFPSGLIIYKSVFNNHHGGRGVIEVFTKIHQSFFNQANYLGFMSDQLRLYRSGIQVNPDINKLSAYPSHSIKQFENAESTGSSISYRCIKCKGCKDCNSTFLCRPYHQTSTK